MEDKNVDNDLFKKPAFLPVTSTSKVTPTENNQTVTEEKPPEENPPPEPECEPPKKPSTSKTISTPIPYTEPSWGGRPDILYSLEVSITFNQKQIDEMLY